MAVRITNIKTGRALTLPNTVTINDFPRDTRAAFLQYSDRHGAAATHVPLVNTMEFTATGTVKTATRTAMQQLLNDIATVVTGSLLRVQPDEGQTRYFEAYLRSFSRPKAMIERVGNFDLAFTAPRPYMLDAPVTLSRVLTASDTNWPVTLLGALPVQPVLRFQGQTNNDFTNFRASHAASGQDVMWEGRVGSNDRLIVDTENYSATLNIGVPATHLLSEEFLINGFELQPENLTLRVRGTGLVAGTLELIYQPRWWW